MDDAGREASAMATKKGGKAAAKQRQEVTLSIPDIGLSKTKVILLRGNFENEIVSSLWRENGRDKNHHH